MAHWTMCIGVVTWVARQSDVQRKVFKGRAVRDTATAHSLTIVPHSIAFTFTLALTSSRLRPSFNT